MSVTLANVDATWVNPGSVTYDAGELRRADAAAFVQAGIVRTSDDALSVSVDGSDMVTVKAGSWAIPGNAVTGSGVWRGGIASDITGTLEARDSTYGRIDLVVARQLDTDVVAAHAAYTGRVEIIKGAPSATPGAPALPNMAVELGRITVPASGGGAASVDLSHRTYAAAPGGDIVVPSASLLPATSALYQRAVDLSNGNAWIWDGSKWSQASGSAAVACSGLYTGTITATLLQGRLLAITGKARRSSGFNSAEHSTGAILPAGLRPVAKVYTNISPFWATPSAFYRFDVATDGTVNVQESAAVPANEDMVINIVTPVA